MLCYSLCPPCRCRDSQVSMFLPGNKPLGSRKSGLSHSRSTGTFVGGMFNLSDLSRLGCGHTVVKVLSDN